MYEKEEISKRKGYKPKANRRFADCYSKHCCVEVIKMKAQITLTPPESKRLIARAVSKMEEVKSAFQKGIILISLSSTNAYILEEIIGIKIKKEKYCSGFIAQEGTCANSSRNMLKEVAIIDGIVNYLDDAREIIKRMNNGDVFIKSANALDHNGHAGVFVGDSDSGELGIVIGHIYARKITFLIPTGLEKLILNIKDAYEVAGQMEYSYSLGYPVSIFPIEGRVITEIDSLRILFNTTATLIGAGGIGGAEGSVTLVLEGKENNISEAFEYIKSIKHEKTFCPSQNKREVMNLNYSKGGDDE
jgi:hypothetical protein